MYLINHSNVKNYIAPESTFDYFFHSLSHSNNSHIITNWEIKCSHYSQILRNPDNQRVECTEIRDSKRLTPKSVGGKGWKEQHRCNQLGHIGPRGLEDALHGLWNYLQSGAFSTQQPKTTRSSLWLWVEQRSSLAAKRGLPSQQLRT